MIEHRAPVYGWGTVRGGRARALLRSVGVCGGRHSHQPRSERLVGSIVLGLDIELWRYPPESTPSTELFRRGP